MNCNCLHKRVLRGQKYRLLLELNTVSTVTQLAIKLHRFRP